MTTPAEDARMVSVDRAALALAIGMLLGAAAHSPNGDFMRSVARNLADQAGLEGRLLPPKEPLL